MSKVESFDIICPHINTQRVHLEVSGESLLPKTKEICEWTYSLKEAWARKGEFQEGGDTTRKVNLNRCGDMVWNTNAMLST